MLIGSWKKPRFRTVVISLVVLLSACATSGYKKFYQPYGEMGGVPETQVLQPGEDPQIYSSDDLDRDVRILLGKGYFAIGYSAFNGPLEPIENVMAQARDVGALLALVSQAYTNTQTSTVPLFIPNNSTTSSSGTVNGYGGSATYSGSSTTYGTSVVPITTQHQRYDQNAIYFVRSSSKPRFGILPVDLTAEIRQKLERNTGAMIYVVHENSPAFVANILEGDVLIKMNGVDVRNAEHAMELMTSAPSEATNFEMIILRNGETRNITVHLDAD